MTVAALIGIILVLGFVAWLVTNAPVIEATHKKFIVFVLLGVSAFIVILFVLSLIDGGSIRELPLY